MLQKVVSSVCSWDTCSASLLHESPNGKVAAMSLSFGVDPRSLGTRVGSSSENPGPGLLEVVDAPNIP